MTGASPADFTQCFSLTGVTSLATEEYLPNPPMTTPNGLRAGRERVGQQIADVDQKREHSTHHTSGHGTDDDANDDPDEAGPRVPSRSRHEDDQHGGDDVE